MISPFRGCFSKRQGDFAISRGQGDFAISRGQGDFAVSRNGEVTLTFTDVCKSSCSQGISIGQIRFNDIRVIKKYLCFYTVYISQISY